MISERKAYKELNRKIDFVKEPVTKEDCKRYVSQCYKLFIEIAMVSDLKYWPSKYCYKVDLISDCFCSDLIKYLMLTRKNSYAFSKVRDNINKFYIVEDYRDCHFNLRSFLSFKYYLDSISFDLLLESSKEYPLNLGEEEKKLYDSIALTREVKDSLLKDLESKSVYSYVKDISEEDKKGYEREFLKKFNVEMENSKTLWELRESEKKIISNSITLAYILKTIDDFAKYAYRKNNLNLK